MGQLAVWEEKLKAKGIKCTKQRCAILKVLVESDVPKSAEEIFTQIKKDQPQLRLSTIYRNLNYFVREEIVRKLKFTTQASKFELITDKHHHHLVCVDCNEIIPLDCPLEEYKAELKSKTSYRITEHRMKFYGLCPTCQQKAGGNKE